MKRLPPITLLIIVSLSVSSCALHLGLSKILNGANSSSPKSGKHAKASSTRSSILTPSGSGPTQTSVLSVARGTAVTLTIKGVQPNVLKAKVNKLVTWTNLDSVPESVTSDTAGLFDSGPLNFSATFTHIFSKTGVFKYHSSTNPNMYGAIVVLP